MSSLWFAHLTHVFSELTTNLTRQEKGVLPTIICFCYFLWIAFCKIKGFKLWLAILSSGQIEMSKRKTRCTFHWTFLDALASLRPMMERLFQTTKYYKSKCLKDREWQYLTIFGSIWQYLETFGNIWQYNLRPLGEQLYPPVERALNENCPKMVDNLPTPPSTVTPQPMISFCQSWGHTSTLKKTLRR